MLSNIKLKLAEEASSEWLKALERAVVAEAQVKELENRIDVLSTVVNQYCSPYYDMKERAEKAEALNKKLLDCLHKVIRQACEDRNGKYDSMCLTAYADAMELLGRFGLLEIRIAYGRSVVAVDKKEQA